MIFNLPLRAGSDKKYVVCIPSNNMGALFFSKLFNNKSWSLVLTINGILLKKSYNYLEMKVYMLKPLNSKIYVFCKLF